MFHLRGRSLPHEEPIDYWIDNGFIVEGPLPNAQNLCNDGWIIPGLVDAHCHLGFSPQGPSTLEQAYNLACQERQAGVLLLRDLGSVVDTREFDHHPQLPRIIRAGRHLARPKRYLPGYAIELEDQSQLVDAVITQAHQGDGWVKLVGDWIDRSVGDLTPLWSEDILTEAISAAHHHGARVTAHVFGEDALPGLIQAGIDCIEHGTGITDDIIDIMAERQIPLVPTLLNVENFPHIADHATKYPTYAAHMRALYDKSLERFSRAYQAGIPIYAGTDAGGMIAHGRIAEEVFALTRIGLSPTEALGAACWQAYTWLDQPQLHQGDRADLLYYQHDPRQSVDVLAHPDLIMIGGKIC